MIKESIDLTENRDFGRNVISRANLNSGRIFEKIKETVDKQMRGKFPWKIDIKDEHKFDGIFALGNKNERKEIREIYYWGTSLNCSCDCCGGELDNSNKIIWKKDIGLCKFCRESLEYRREINFF